MWFLSSLVVAMSAIAIYGKLETISEEGAIACIAVGLISAITSIVAAPWQFHLLLFLLLVAFRTKLFRELPDMNLASFASFSTKR